MPGKNYRQTSFFAWCNVANTVGTGLPLGRRSRNARPDVVFWPTILALLALPKWLFHCFCCTLLFSLRVLKANPSLQKTLPLPLSVASHPAISPGFSVSWGSPYAVCAPWWNGEDSPWPCWSCPWRWPLSSFVVAGCCLGSFCLLGFNIFGVLFGWFSMFGGSCLVGFLNCFHVNVAYIEPQRHPPL